MVAIELGEVVVDGSPSNEQEAMLQVNAPFRLQVEDVSVVNEPSFPILELAKALQLWDGRGVFEYRSIEADVSPLLLVETRSGFYVASPLSRICSDAIVDRKKLLSALTLFIESVRKEISARNLHFLS